MPLAEYGNHTALQANTPQGYDPDSSAGNEMKTYSQLDKYERRDLFREAIREVLRKSGWMFREVERNKALTLHMKQGNDDLLASARTSSDQWLGFAIERGTQRYLGDEILNDGKTHVVIAVPDRVDSPDCVLVYMVKAADLEKCFRANYDAHKSEKRLPNHTSMWISLFHSERKGPGGVGSGILEKIKPLGRVAIRDLLDAREKGHNIAPIGTQPRPTHTESIGDVLRDAKERIARIAGVPIEVVRLDLKLES